MKVRNGFVSNSSSSSFMMYGCEIDRYDFLRQVMKIDIDNSDEEENLYESLDNFLSKTLENTDLTFVAPYEYSTVMIGRSWCQVKDEETGAQFKESVRKKIAEIFGSEFECDTMVGEYCS